MGSSPVSITFYPCDLGQAMEPLKMSVFSPVTRGYHYVPIIDQLPQNQIDDLNEKMHNCYGKITAQSTDNLACAHAKGTVLGTTTPEQVGQPKIKLKCFLGGDFQIFTLLFQQQQQTEKDTERKR